MRCRTPTSAGTSCDRPPGGRSARIGPAAGHRMSGPRPTQLTLHKASHLLEVGFDDGRSWKLPCEYLRVESPSAEVQGHGPGQKVLVAGKRDVNIRAIEPMGNYGVLLRFDDGHDTGIFSWPLLQRLGEEYEVRWAAYTAALAAAGLSR